MTHPLHFTGSREAIQLLAEHGFDGLAPALELLLNEVMKLERCEVLRAAPYERTEERKGYANGFKAKTVHSRVGDLQRSVPQTRDVDFYPQALQRGVRSERALTAALAEMYVCGVSTRKVSRVVEELCGHEVSSSTVSRLTAQLDEELERRLTTAVAKYAKTAPKLAHWMESNVPQSLTVFCLPARHRVRVRTSNMLERLNRELKRRTRVVGIFPNDDALLRLASAVRMEIDEHWLAGRKYLTMETH